MFLLNIKSNSIRICGVVYRGLSVGTSFLISQQYNRNSHRRAQNTHSIQATIAQESSKHRHLAADHKCHIEIGRDHKRLHNRLHFRSYTKIDLFVFLQWRISRRLRQVYTIRSKFYRVQSAAKKLYWNMLVKFLTILKVVIVIEIFVRNQDI